MLFQKFRAMRKNMFHCHRPGLHCEGLLLKRKTLAQVNLLLIKKKQKNMSDYQNNQVIKNAKTQRYEMDVEGHTAFVEYEEDGNNVALTHTEVPNELRGKGIAAILVKKTLEKIKADNKTFSPICPYVLSFVKRNPEWKSMVDENFEGRAAL